MRRLIALAGVAVLSGAAASGPHAMSVMRTSRCYAIRLDAVRWGAEPEAWYRPLPVALELRDTTPKEARTPAWQPARRVPASPEGDQAAWRRAGDTTIVRLPRGWSSGLIFRVIAVGDSLVGRLTDYAHYDPRQAAEGRVRLLPRACPIG